MICLILGDTDFPKKVLKNVQKNKVNYFIIDLSKKNIFKKCRNCNRISIGQFGKMIKLMKINKCKKVLFITKKKAISSIESDYNLLTPGYSFQAINYESIHKLPKVKWDMIICDEAHSMGAYPKPSKRAKQVKELLKYSNPKVILLSGTPTPESYSQMYHQVY